MPKTSASSLIRTARLDRGLTQRRLAERTGISQPAIARLEANRHSPTVETLERLLSPLGLRLELRTVEIDTGVDQTLIVENLRLSPEQRLRKLGQFVRGLGRLRQAMPENRR